jgi:uncharacterized membrane protein
MIFSIESLNKKAHGSKAANLFQDKKLKASEQQVGILLTGIGLFLWTASTVSNVDFQRQWCYASLAIHGMLFGYRFLVQRTIDEVKDEAMANAIVDVIFASGWVYHLSTL